jgi:hypothetical protein
VPRRKKTPPLPEDVIEIIFYYLFPDLPFSSPEVSWGEEGCKERYTKARLAQFCLLSRAWLVPTRRVLYRTITHPYNHATKAPLLWNLINNVAQIRTYIFRLIMLPEDLHHVSLSEIKTVLPRCTVFLTIIPGATRMSPERVTSSDCVGYLRAGWDQMEGYTRDMWISAFTNWTRLEVLHIQASLVSFFPFDVAEQDGLFLPSLRVLRLRMMREVIPIPPTSPNTLHTLCLVSLEGLTAEPFLALIHRHSYSLRRLHVAYVGFDYMAPHSILTDAVSQLRGLESLFIHRADQYLLDTIYPVLSVTLAELSLVADCRRPPTYAVFREFVLAPHRSLRAIMMDLRGGNPRSNSGKEWASLARTSKERTVQILFNSYSEVFSLPPWARLN